MGMDLNESQRRDLAARVRRERVRQFKGNRRAAYSEAGVNSNTWSKAEAGESLAERSVIAIVRTLWPETGGDWTAMDPPLGRTDDEIDPELEILNADISQETKEYALRLLAEDKARREDRERGAS